MARYTVKVYSEYKLDGKWNKLNPITVPIAFFEKVKDAKSFMHRLMDAREDSINYFGATVKERFEDELTGYILEEDRSCGLWLTKWHYRIEET